MKNSSITSVFITSVLLASSRLCASTGEAFYGDPPDAHHPWAVHDQNRPQPPRVEPGPFDAAKAKAPADAIVLFDGTEASLKNWEADKPGSEPTKWTVSEGNLVCVPKSGYIRTKAQFGDCQLHVEWSAPTPAQGESQGRGNSGIFLEGSVEVQVLDNYNNPTYADGFACSVYATCPPLANALRPPGEFQAIDITFRRPVYQGDKLIEPGFVTVYCNGVLVQDRTQYDGPTGHMKRPKATPLAEVGPLKLQDHGNPVRYRNIWYRPLPARTADEVAKTVPMSEEATTAKRKEIAATVRADAEKIGDATGKLLRMAESLVYEKDEATYKTVEQQALAFAAATKALPADKIESKKDETKRLHRALQYLKRFNIIDGADAAAGEIEAIVKAHGWEKK